MTAVPVFDGHNDLLARLFIAPGQSVAPYLEGRPRGHIDAAKVKAGGLAGGLFAIWVPSPSARAGKDPASAMTRSGYALPLAEPVGQPEALEAAGVQLRLLRDLEVQGALSVCTDAGAIERAMARGSLAAVIHMEGAEAIGPDLAELDALHAQGLRSLGPVWSRPTVFGHGVPFHFPADPDIGPGLTDAGQRLVARCDDLRILLDVSHLNAAGFRDVARLSSQPLVATHSNAHALCPHARNLTDWQLDAIAETGGLVGLNFATAFLRADGRMVGDTPVETMLAHLDHLIDRLGEGGVALGSDFDGAVVPRAIGSAAGLPVLVEAMRRHGFGEALVARLCHRNWLDLLARIWGR